jgi:hypothetical protein
MQSNEEQEKCKRLIETYLFFCQGYWNCFCWWLWPISALLHLPRTESESSLLQSSDIGYRIIDIDIDIDMMRGDPGYIV